jgi:hypothetical protein
MQSKTAAQQAKLILKSAAMEADIVECGGGKEWRSGSPRFVDGPASVQTVANGKTSQTPVRVRQATQNGAKRTESSRNRGGSSRTAERLMQQG